MPKQKRERNKILLTGGHAGTTAVAVIDELQGAVDIFWIGATSAFEGKKVETIEEMVFQKSEVKSFKIPTGKINHKYPYKSILSLFKLPFGFVAALYLLIVIRPKVILSFGGSVSIPVVFAAWVCRKTIVLHEQTIAAGKANIEMSRFANKVTISRQESAKYFPIDKTLLTGNPVQKSIRQLKPKTKLSQNPNILVVGGSRGASVINDVVIESITDILKMFNLHHITGRVDYLKLINARQKLPKNLADKYHVYPVVNPKSMYKMYDLSDLIISRSGANIVSEILIAKRPTIFIPIPWTYNDEQNKNAKFVEKLGSAIVLDQDGLTGRDLVMALQMVVKKWDSMVANAIKYESPDRDAAQKLASIVLEYLK
ncbi:glycosyltransferase [Patescibacteria group bacterium]